MAGTIPDYGYQYWNYYPYYPYYYPQLSHHTQMNRTPQQTYEDWKKRQLLEKKVKVILYRNFLEISEKRY